MQTTKAARRVIIKYEKLKSETANKGVFIMSIRAQKRNILKDGNLFTCWRVIRARKENREIRLNRLLNTRPRARHA